MKNLKLLYNRNATLGQKNVKHIRLSGDQVGITYISTEDGLLSFDWNCMQQNEILPLGNVIGIEQLSLNNEICAATANGDVRVFNLSTKAEESVTFCDGGINAMAWSHDQEVVAFVTCANLLVVMNSAYDPLNETRLDDDEFGDGQFITVGWGKKETQFHGTEGKAAAKKQTETIEVDDISALDPCVSIVWRGDDEYFAVSFVGHNGRMFKVFDKEGRLKYTSEKWPGLEAPIAWKPSGSWIAVPHVLPNKYAIALFEKNGLRHREIVLPFRNSDEQVQKLLWSSDSEVLAIYTVHGGASSIYLYTIGNYHWYLKQTLRFKEHCQALLWDQNYSEGKTLHVVQANGRYSTYRWEHIVNQSNGHTIQNQAIVAVVDRTNLFLTNFRGAVIPPPMCAVTLKHSTCINQIGFLTNSDAATDLNRFFIVDETNTFNVFECSLNVNAQRNINVLKDSILLKTYSLPIENEMPLAYHHWLWLSGRQIVFCENDGASTVIYLGELSETTDEIIILDNITIDGIVGNVTAQGANDAAIVYHLITGEFFAVAHEKRKWRTPETLFDVSCFCEQIATATVDGETRVLALKQQQNLYIDDRKVASDVTSFLTDEQFLLFTSLDKLKFVRLASEQTINERRIERGGKLIVSVPCDSRTVFQMPRGNLEAIQPRVLSLCIIGKLLDAGSYRKVFDLLRKQRINLNLLVDHNPAKFLENLSQFVTEIGNTHWLNLFLSDLQNEDVTRTMYASNYQHLPGRVAGLAENVDKIDTICERTCQMCEQIDAAKFVLPIITAHVKRKNLEAALTVVWKVRKAELKSAADAAGVVSSHEALKYLLYLVNVNELYDVALGMYDFDLVLFVAQQSQKDPKEYIPFLNELKGFEENYRRYRIDSHLKRYEKALPHIVKCGVEKVDECLELIEKQNLHTHALRLFKPTDECYNDIVLQFADHLRTKGVFYDACLMYERGGDYKQAMLTAKHTLDWRKCLLLAKKSSCTDDEIDQLCASLIPALQENDKFKDAAELVKRYRNNFDLYVKLLCDGNHYHDAIFEARNHSESSVNFVRIHLAQYAMQLVDKIRADCDQFGAYTHRLQKVRKEKSERLLNGIDDDVDNCDMFSDTSSMNSSRFTGTSKGSGKSHRSSKNRRKHERKLMSLKEGNPFEDIALVDAIYLLTHKSYGQQQHIRDILQSLIDVELDGEGVKLQKTYGALLFTVRESLDKIWIPEMMVSGEVKVEEIMDYVKVQNEQHYAMIKPHQRVKPLLTVIEWQFEILK